MLQVAAIHRKALPVLLTTRSAPHRGNNVLCLVGEYDGRFFQSRLRQKERSIGQSHYEEQTQQGDGQPGGGYPRTPRPAAIRGQFGGQIRGNSGDTLPNSRLFLFAARVVLFRAGFLRFQDATDHPSKRSKAESRLIRTC